MPQWYYVDAGSRRQGPVEGPALAALWRDGQVGIDTLVWREGQDGWQRLELHRHALGLAEPDGGSPPPLPPAAALPGQPHAATAAPRPRLSGCVVALIVGAVLLVPGTAILAAIAIPAYQQYVLRTKVANAVASAEPLQARIAAHLAREQRCPRDADPGFGQPSGPAATHVARTSVGEFDSGLCGLELVLGQTGSEAVDDKALWLEYDRDAGTWQCTSEIDDRYLPRDCRG